MKKKVRALKSTINSPLADALQTIAENASVKRFLKDVERNQSLMRAAEGPLAELRRAGVFDPVSPLRRELEQTRLLLEGFEAQFRLPEIVEAKRLMSENASVFADVLKRYHLQTASVQRAMASMKTSWLDTQEAMRSVGGFAKLQGIGKTLTHLPAYDLKLESALRVDLGDWRDRITWHADIFNNLEVRSEFYQSLGFDPTLTDFPASAFDESLDIAGVNREAPPLVALYGPPVPPSVDHEEEARLERTNMAHDWLLRLETNVRRFIDEQMAQVYGPNWPNHRLPNGLYDKWRQKKATAEQAGTHDWPLIAYADFTDYERVICKGDNWREVFGNYFGRPESVRETFQRLYPIRVDTMHARPITQDDELLLYVETKRLVEIIIS